MLYFDGDWVKMFSGIAKALHSLTGLQDENTESELVTTDRVTVGGSAAFTSVDQASVTAAVVGRTLNEKLLTSVDLQGNLEQQGEKFYLIFQGTWSTESEFVRICNLDVLAKLKDIDFAISGLTDFHAYLRCGVEVMVQINPTQYHQGCLMVALIPADEAWGSISGLTTYPHGILNCNINNVIRIKVPFVYTRGAYNLRNPEYTVWRLVIYVYNKLKAGTGTEAKVSFSVLARACDVELHGLMPKTNIGSEKVRISSSQNIVNTANRFDSGAEFTLALGQEDFLSDVTNAGGMKVKHLSTWTRVPTLLGQILMSSAQTVGTKLAVLNVDPYFHTVKTASGAKHEITNLAAIAQMFCFWRGDIVYHFQVVPTRFHAGRLLVCFVPGNENTDTSKLTIQKATSGLCAVMDIEGVASTMIFRVPYISDTPYRSNLHTQRGKAKGSYMSIGKIVVFVYNKLTHPVTVHSSIDINVYVSACNLELYGPIYETVSPGVLTANSGEDELVENKGKQNAFDTGGYTSQDNTVGKEYVDKPEKTVPIGAVTAIEDPKLEKKPPQTFPERAPGKPRHTVDHMDMYQMMGRAHFLCAHTFAASDKVYTIPIDFKYSSTDQTIASTLEWFMSLFHLYRGPIDMTIVISGAHDVDGICWFTPIGMALEKIWTEDSPDLTIDYTTSLGCVRFNTSRTGNIQMRLPWYSFLYAVSGNLGDEGHHKTDDSYFGSVSIMIKNYTSADEYLGISVFLSFTEQSEFLFPRAPIKTNLLKTNGLQPIRGLESSVDDESPIPPPRRGVMVESISPYRDLRLRVGAERLRYAHDELHSQAGSMFADCVLVQKREGSLLLRGFAYSGRIYYADCEPRQLKDIPLLKNGLFKNEVESGDWLALNTTIDEELARTWSQLEVSKVRFCWFDFVRGKMESSFHGSDWAHLKSKFSDDELKSLLEIFSGKSLGAIDKIIMDSVVLGDVQETGLLVKSLATECKTVLDQMSAIIQRVAKGFSKRKFLIVSRMLSAIIKLGLKLYICVKTSWQPHVAIPLLMELALECGDLSMDMTGLVKTMVEEVAELVGRDETDGLKSQSATWLRDMVCCVSLFKSAKSCFDWVVDKFQDWFKEKFGEKQKILELLNENEERVDALVTFVDEFVIRDVTEGNSNNFVSDGLDLIKQLRTLHSIVTTDKELSKHQQIVRDSINRVHAKLRSVKVNYENAVVRAEPVVLYLYGERGCGKSLLSMAIAVKICKALGLDPSSNIYTKPVGASYWDGYANQAVCLIDDIGQNTDDADWADFCQLVSGCPYRLNMAGLDQKGVHFTSPYIICTSNTESPDPRVVYHREAVLRRLHIKIRVSVKDYYAMDRGVSRVLNVEKAKRDGMIANMDCLSMNYEGVDISLGDIVSSVISAVERREANMDEFMSLWSQSNGPDSFQFFLTRNSTESNGKASALLRSIRDHKLLILGSLLGVLSGVGIIYGVYKMFKSKNGVQSEGAYNGQTKVNRVVRLDTPTMTSQSIVELSVLIQKNLVRLGTSGDGETVMWHVNAFGIYDEWMLIPHHAFKFDSAFEYFFVQKAGVTYSCPKDKVEIYELGREFNDVVLVKMPNIPKFKDVRHHFVKKQDIQSCDGKLATLCTINGGLFQLIAEGPIKLCERASYSHKIEDGKHVTLTITDGWRGTGDALPGSCGGPLVSSNHRLQNPIIGLHVASGGGQMLSTVVYREMFDVITNGVLNSQRIAQVMVAQSDVPMASKTEFRRSPIYDVMPLPVEKMPASLPYNRNCEVDVLQVMLSKYSVPVVEEPMDYECAVWAYVDQLVNVFGNPEFKLLTVNEVVLGIDGMDGLNMNTSAGIPYTLYHERKRDMFDEHGNIISERLQSRLHLHHVMAPLGLSLDVTFQTCAKDELRKVEKVITGNTRTIEAAPVDFTIFVRQVFGNFVAKLQSNPGWRTGIAVGVDPDRDWEQIYLEAIRFGPTGIDADFKNFDASISPFMMKYGVEVLGYMSAMCGPVTQSIAQTLMSSKHQIRNVLITVRGSMPSGVPCTSVLNSIINNINWLYVMSRVLKINVYDVRKLCRFLCYGDDVIVSVSKEVKVDEAMLHDIQAEFLKIGMIVTGSDKGPLRVKPILDVSFLKRDVFVDPEHRIHPRIELATIWALLQWTRTKAEFKENVQNACWFAYHHGEEFYNQFLNMLSGWVSQVGCDISLPSFSQQEGRFRSMFRGRNLS
uniref:Genome polyprotein n=1 Tax=Loch Leven virus TaxID=2776924 RepID=A0A8E4QJ98_9PICO|nr:MAG: polyprotein [Loch Leven virus]